VISNQAKSFQAIYKASVAADLTTMIVYLNKGIKQANSAARRSAPPTPEIQIPQNPHFLLVTGTIDIRRTMGLREKPSLAAIYVAETNTGIVMAYVLPWNASSHLANVNEAGTLIPWAGYAFSAPVIAAEK
jgi:hypothetical protein